MDTIQLQADTTFINMNDLPDSCGPYQVQFDPSPFIVLRLAVTIDHASFNWTHPKVIAQYNDYLEFKHYRAGGSKFWTGKAGREFYIVVPKTQIALVKKFGGSWPQVVINGETVTLNVSGGGGATWVDSVRGIASTSCNIPKRTLNKLAAVALTLEQCKEQQITIPVGGVSDFSRERWVEKCAQYDIELKPGMMVAFLEGYSFRGLTGPFPFVKMMRRSYLVDTGLGNGRSSVQGINWIETAKINNLPIRQVNDAEFNKTV